MIGPLACVALGVGIGWIAFYQPKPLWYDRLVERVKVWWKDLFEEKS